MSCLHAGLSGYSYRPWQGEGRFYPPGLKQSEYLAYYSERYDSVEMDGTWYQMPSEKSVEVWLSKTPERFWFCPKAHRQITHYARLKPESYRPLAFMLARLAPLARAGKLGPILLQLPPRLPRNDERLQSFLEHLPVQAPTEEKAEGADDQTVPRLRWAIEFRNESWHCPQIEEALRGRGVAWVAAETDESEAELRDTSDFLYARLRKSVYTDDELRKWAEYLISAKKDCFVFIKHEDEGSPWVYADKLIDYAAATVT